MLCATGACCWAETKTNPLLVPPQQACWAIGSKMRSNTMFCNRRSNITQPQQWCGALPPLKFLALNILYRGTIDRRAASEDNHVSVSMFPRQSCWAAWMRFYPQWLRERRYAKAAVFVTIKSADCLRRLAAKGGSQVTRRLLRGTSRSCRRLAMVLTVLRSLSLIRCCCCYCVCCINCNPFHFRHWNTPDRDFVVVLSVWCELLAVDVSAALYREQWQ